MGLNKKINDYKIIFPSKTAKRGFFLFEWSKENNFFWSVVCLFSK